MKKLYVLIGATATVLLARSPAVQAKSVTLGNTVAPHVVTPGDTFSFDLVGYNNTAGVAAYAVAPQDVTFGGTTTLTGVGLGGSNVTVTSSETIGVTSTTDTFTVSTTSNFVPTGYKISGYTIKGLEFDIDQDTTYADPVNVVTPITSYTSSGSCSYSGTPNFALSPQTTLLNSGSAYQMYEAISAGSGSINSLAVTSFTYSITYPTVPEASSFGVIGGILLLLVAGYRLRRRLA